ncbi:MAG: hypothetical protein KGJ79_14835 [Alphaproteobacteria bacterium]|nr:hypothetical protein [Alphaproteobacteria bacterium]MDE2493269.1 hypothetical protein [Alphaproteobacteria bacterium]
MRTLPRARASWGEAMEREIRHIESDAAALRWAMGCVFAGYRERIGIMTLYQKINRVGAVAPTVMSLLALSIVLVVATTGWERQLKDEGAAAHIFQLLIVGQLPFIAIFLATANWKRLTQIAKPIAVQVCALVLALGSVAFSRL